MICNEENDARRSRGRSNSQQLVCKRAFGTALNSGELKSAIVDEAINGAVISHNWTYDSE